MVEQTQIYTPHVPVVDRKVREVMLRQAVTASPEDSLKEVAARMLEHDVSVVPVVDRTGGILGVISDADLVRIVTTPHRGEIIVNGQSRVAATGSVGSSMSRQVVGVREDSDLTQVARLMVEQGFKALPVVSGGRLVGMVTRQDILRLMVRPDEEIHREVSDTLELVTDRPVTYSAKDGVVTFDQWVEPGGRRYLEHAIKTVPGVFAVTFMESAP